MYVVANDVNEAWETCFAKLYKQYEEGFTNPSRDGEVVGEELNAMIVVKDPTRNIVTSPIRKLSLRYAIGELMWYLSGSNQIESIAKFSKAWLSLSDNGVTANSAYGYRIFHKFGFDQWENAKSLLSRDRMSRQAVIHIKEADNSISKDVPCTIALQFFIRYNRQGEPELHMTTYMRSNDVWMGLPYDMFSFCCLQMKMAMELNIRIGTYTHVAGSLHLYKRSIDAADKNIMKG